MTTPHLHELHKVVDDLTRRKQYAVAFALCEVYRHDFDDGYLHHHYLTLPWRMRNLDKTIALMREAVEQNRWISTWYMQQFGTFAELMQEPSFQAMQAEIRTAEQAYWHSELARPITTVPNNATAPLPLLIALPCNGLNAAHSAENWSTATQYGWLTTHPLAPNIIGYHQHWWNEMAQSKQTVLTHYRPYKKSTSLTMNALCWLVSHRADRLRSTWH